MIVADNETAVDLLYYESVAGTVVRLLNEKSDEPLSVGVHGDWGAGKSSVLMMIEEALAGQEGVLCVRYNGWLFQGFEDAKAVLIETIVEELLRARSGSKKVRDKAQEVLRRVDWMKVARKSASYGLTAMTGIPSLETVRDLGALASAVIGKGDEGATGEDLAALVDGAGEYVKEVGQKGAAEQMHAFREEFKELLENAEIERLVVLVDDLDRCLPATSIETLEAIRLFLFVPRAAFVIAADEGMIEYAVRQHFPDLPVATGPATYARNYLEKLIQVPFRLPSLGYAETRIYVTMLLVLNECGEDSGEFTKLVGVARDALRRPWQGSGLRRKAMEDSLGPLTEPVARSLDLANRISRILADGARGNPRQIKRFINAMHLRRAIAEQRGFGDDVKESVLAKVMLAERFAPAVYDVIARGSASTGRSKELVALETLVAAEDGDSRKAKSSKKSQGGVGDGNDADVVGEWQDLEWAKKWARIEPRLAEEDLRPYVFVTRDNSRGLFGGVASLGDLEELLSVLQESQFRVRQASATVARLEASDAERLFEALRAKVTATEDLTVKPSGVAGLVEICRHHPSLQIGLAAMLEELPVSRLGAWVVSGWSGGLTDETAKRRFEAVLGGWAAQDENKKLKAAAVGASKLGSKRGRR